MARSLLFVLLALTVAPILVTSLRCRQCGTYECVPPTEKCNYGEVTDVCNCCPACAKGANERCGAPWNMAGKCAKGMECVKDPKDNDNINAAGTCKVTNVTQV